ncbi:GNAT family N-acetyltransferase [[Acidovorax] ebreus]|uniref:GCN5-related N-acetyltransferase n=1 Tax=Acidovorax ebreus (strain TPSY) TaxID=535289 RepID=A0A9J9Q892_ACIET|nr:GNAT family N-acetyltransferase [[Acidovorax] ebreus]ACM34354.1 GCN5-related N-acetyltransferase [[Acidovorax] ebreus TPSY]
MNLFVREATADDLPDVLALYAQPGLDDAQVLDLERAREIHAQFARYPHYHLYVACDADAPDRVVASYALLVMHNLAHMGTPSAIAEDVVVDAACRGQGIGRRLMAHAVERARAAGCYKLALSSNRRRTQAHGFYESLGFERHGYSFVIETQA